MEQNPVRHLRRVGCGLAVVLWLLVMVSPCFLFFLATQGEISVALGGAPEQTLRIWLVNEIQERGLGLSWASVHAGEGDLALCVQTDTRFILWAGAGEPSTYCACYTRANPAAAWMPAAARSGSCEP